MFLGADPAPTSANLLVTIAMSGYSMSAGGNLRFATYSPDGFCAARLSESQQNQPNAVGQRHTWQPQSSHSDLARYIEGANEYLVSQFAHCVPQCNHKKSCNSIFRRECSRQPKSERGLKIHLASYYRSLGSLLWVTNLLSRRRADRTIQFACLH